MVSEIFVLTDSAFFVLQSTILVCNIFSIQEIKLASSSVGTSKAIDCTSVKCNMVFQITDNCNR